MLERKRVERLEQIADTLRAVFAALLQAGEDQEVELDRYCLRSDGRDLARLVVQDVARELEIVGALEQLAAGEHEESDGADRVDIHACVDVGRIAQALRRHVKRRSQDAEAPRQVAAV